MDPTPAVPRGNGTDLSVSGMTCTNCARRVTDAIRSVPGVQSADVQLQSHHAAVRWADGAAPDVPAVIRAIEAKGYGAKLETRSPAHDHGAEKMAGWQINLWIGVLGTAPLMLGEWAFQLGMQPWFGPRLAVSSAGDVFTDTGDLVDDHVRSQLQKFMAGFAAFAARR